MGNLDSPLAMQNYKLHPLIHTPLEFNLAQYIVGCQETVGTKRVPH